MVGCALISIQGVHLIVKKPTPVQTFTEIPKFFGETKFC